MERIEIFVDGRPFGIHVSQWLIEDCKDCFWGLGSDGYVLKLEKPRYSFKKAEVEK